MNRMDILPEGVDITHRFIELISQDRDILNRMSPPCIGTNHSTYCPDRKQLHYGDTFYSFGFDYLPDDRHYSGNAHYVLQKMKYLGRPDEWAPSGSFSFKRIWACNLSGHISSAGKIKGGITEGFHPFLSIILKKAVFVTEQKYGETKRYIYVQFVVNEEELIFCCSVRGPWRSYLDISQ